MSDLEGIQKGLQEDIGEKPEVTVGTFEIWSTTRSIKNLLVVKPTCLAEVQAVVKAAVKNKASTHYTSVTNLCIFSGLG